MKIWHKSLVRYLPDRLLIAQWNDCCKAAASGMHGEHLFSFGVFVADEITNRGMIVPFGELRRFIINCDTTHVVPFDELYTDWHDELYLAQCWFELYEMHSMGAMSDTDWDSIQEGVHAA